MPVLCQYWADAASTGPVLVCLQGSEGDNLWSLDLVNVVWYENHIMLVFSSSAAASNIVPADALTSLPAGARRSAGPRASAGPVLPTLLQGLCQEEQHMLACPLTSLLKQFLNPTSVWYCNRLNMIPADVLICQQDISRYNYIIYHPSQINRRQESDLGFRYFVVEQLLKLTV